MNRAVRRHPTKEAKPGKAAIRPLPRGSARAAPRHEGRAFPLSILSWRPRFFMDIYNELRKVVWPTREDTIHLTVVVVIVTLILGAVLGAIDIGFGWLIDNTLLR